jgi:hypothetical protein
MEKRTYTLVGEISVGEFEETVFDSYEEAASSIQKKPYIYTTIIENIPNGNSEILNLEEIDIPEPDHSYYKNGSW